MKDYIKIGIEKNLISFNEDMSRIVYVFQNKERNYNNPEEKVQADTFLRLIIDYNYPVNRIRQFVPVTMGREVKEADIVVYDDDMCMSPHILVECKRQEVSEAEYQQAVEQAFSYAFALPCDVKYVWVTSGIKSDYFEVDKNQNSRNQMPDIPQFGVRNVASYKYVYGAEYLPEESGKQRFFDLSVIEQSDLTRRFKQAHEALWAGGQLNPSEAFDELDKLIFCKIWDERKPRKVGEPYDFQIITVSKEDEKNENKRRLIENDNLYKRIMSLYEEGRAKDKEVFRDNIRLTPEKIRTVVGYLESINLGETDLDSKGRAFETFMGSFFRGTYGQYFTPREIVQFVVDVLPIQYDSKVLDTSCGSGGFLLYALNKVRTKATQLYPNYKTDTRQYKHWFSYWHDFAANNLYGIEISEQISRAAKMNMIIHDDGHTNVITSDGLISEEAIIEKTSNQGFQYGTFDFIITNPPFGSTIRQSEQAYLKTYQLGKKEEDWLAITTPPQNTRDGQSTEVLFIEQDYKFLKEGGYLAIVLPDGILTNSSMQYVRTQIEDWFRIVAVVSLPQTAFMANGAGVKSSVLFLKKWTKKESESLSNAKKSIEYRLLKENNYLSQRQEWEKELKAKQKEKANEIKDQQKISITAAKQTDKYKSWNSDLLAKYADKVDELKSRMTDEYQQAKRKELVDYPIFMAIAEEIGYDASGKKTSVNELNVIGEELKKFINSL
ncbi:MAG: N-6 DNA methylase [Bacteroidetes bacterium]|uniref:N-6 DNA methylase n=1 Tax=Candidatus Cryptobacteroides intestinigallinarum TaxID=2840767 RepID=A0A9D9HJU3_9BACT|nr:N-6 DNA methylase [Candidatus Cryptobacteroides intestinigallinarum]